MSAVTRTQCSLPGMVAPGVLDDLTGFLTPGCELTKLIEKRNEIGYIVGFGKGCGRNLKADDHSRVPVDMKSTAGKEGHGLVRRDDAELDPGSFGGPGNRVELLDHHVVRSDCLSESCLGLDEDETPARSVEPFLSPHPFAYLGGVDVGLHRYRGVAGHLQCAEHHHRLEGANLAGFALERTPAVLESEGIAALDHESAVFDARPGLTREGEQLLDARRTEAVALSEPANLSLRRQGLPGLDARELGLRDHLAGLTAGYVDLAKAAVSPGAPQSTAQLSPISIRHLRNGPFDGALDAESTTY